MSEWILFSRVRPVPPVQVILSVGVGDRVEVRMISPLTGEKLEQVLNHNDDPINVLGNQVARLGIRQSNKIATTIQPTKGNEPSKTDFKGI